MTVRIRRAYEDPQPDDGNRLLVDRIWPRGRSRDALRLDAWHRELAPSDQLRRWFGHDPRRWAEFRQRYRAELASPEAQRQLDELAAIARTGTLTLVYGAADTDHNQAVVLAELVGERVSGDR
jgi:uncharacterized protein YeaO (DUF488 family)